MNEIYVAEIEGMNKFLENILIELEECNSCCFQIPLCSNVETDQLSGVQNKIKILPSENLDINTKSSSDKCHSIQIRLVAILCRKEPVNEIDSEKVKLKHL